MDEEKNKKINFDEKEWKANLKKPDWYVRLEDQLENFIFPKVHGEKKKEIEAVRNRIYELIEKLYINDKIPLADSGPDLDEGRKDINKIIIHHTEENPQIRLSKLSAIGLVRQYAKAYLNNDVRGHKLKGKPIWSDHFKEGKMVFFAYHWLVRPDGTAERLLKDEHIGWHVADWDIKKESVAIALSGNYLNNRPPEAQIEGVAKVVRKNYPKITQKAIYGHCEVQDNRTCPGENFIPGWKNNLLNYI